MANENDIAQIVAVISAAYPNFSPSEMTTEVYYQTLRDIPADLLKAATLQAVSEPGRKFAPSVGEIRGAVLEINRAIDKTPSAYEGWEATRKAMFGGWPPDIHPMIVKVADLLGGLRTLGHSTNPVSDRMRYIEAYNELLERTQRGQIALPEVRGYIEAHGGELPPPVEQMKQLGAKWNVRDDETLPGLVHPDTLEVLE
jgi:hypothetical protein